MKNLLLLSLCFLAASFSSTAQNCAQTFSDDYSNPSLWKHVGTVDNVVVANGVCRFNNALSGAFNYYDKIYRPLPFTLSGGYWKAEFKFTPGPNNTNNGLGGVLFAVTADSLDFMTYDIDEGSKETSQDEIGIVLFSNNSMDNVMSDWQFIPESKKGNVRVSSASTIGFSNIVPTYYLRLETLSNKLMQLSVFSDSTRLNHAPGSPVSFYVDSTITGLQYIQHGITTPATASRSINGTVDNLNICKGFFTDVADVKANSKWHIYPDPVGNELHINAASFASAKSIELYDLLGRVVIDEQNITASNQTIDVSALKDGPYYLRIKTIDGEYVKTIVKQ